MDDITEGPSNAMDAADIPVPDAPATAAKPWLFSADPMRRLGGLFLYAVLPVLVMALFIHGVYVHA